MKKENTQKQLQLSQRFFDAGYKVHITKDDKFHIADERGKRLEQFVFSDIHVLLNFIGYAVENKIDISELNEEKAIAIQHKVKANEVFLLNA